MFLILAVVVAGIFSYHKAVEKRRGEMRELVAAHDWEYQQSNRRLPQNWGAGILRGTPFAQGVARDIVYGSYLGHDFTAFTSVVSNGKTSTAYAVAVLRLRSALPNMGIVRMDFGQKVAKAFGAQDILTGDDGFDNAYRVRADNVDFARIFLGAKMVAWLMEPLHYGAPYIIEGGDVLTWRLGEMRARDVEDEIATLAEFVDQINPDIWGMFGTPIRELR
jgi:hypothetical protein